jgi:hypothetical protein
LKRNPIILFLTALIVTSIVIGLVIGVIGMLTFDLAGGETLDQVEGQNVMYLIFSIVLLVIAIVCAISYIKKGNKFTAYGIMVAASLLLIAMTIYVVKEHIYPNKFDQVVWKQATWKPEGMAKALTQQKKLVGLSRAQIKEMLGEGSEEYGDINSDRGSIIYSVENDWTFSVLFQKDKVLDIEMRRPRLMTKSRGQHELSAPPWGEAG